MSTIAVSLKITRSAIGLADLELNDRVNGYTIAGTGDWGDINWRRREVTSPWVSGSFLADAVPDQVHSSLTVEVTATSQTQLAERVRVIVAAFSQLEYQLTWTIAGMVNYWYCSLADFHMEWSRERMHLNRAILTMQVSRQPSDNFMTVVPVS